MVGRPERASRRRVEVEFNDGQQRTGARQLSVEGAAPSQSLMHTPPSQHQQPTPGSHGFFCRLQSKVARDQFGRVAARLRRERPREAAPAALDPRATRYYKHVKNGGAKEALETDFRGRGASRR